MVSCYLQGGLGNQLFQIATAYSLSIDNNDEFLVNFNAGSFTQKPAIEYKNNVLYKIKELINLSACKYVYYEPFFKYNEIPYTKDIVLHGYFQSEKYFLKNKELIQKLFLNDNIIDQLKSKYQNILDNSVSIHIRRGDYLTKPSFHTNQKIDYYTNSINYLQNIKNILIFSDDIDWCKSNFIDDRISFISELSDYEDLYLMSLCENNITANSSFSWWGAWLNLNKNKKVIMPKLWFGPSANIDWSDIYFENIITI